MADMKPLKPHPLMKSLALALLFLAAALALYALAAHHPMQWDVTQNASNTLQEASQNVLQQLPGELTLTVYATGQDATLGDIHRAVRDFMANYLRYKPNITIAFVDPVKEPDKMRGANIQANGEIVVQYGERSEHLTQLNEQALTSALLRLAHSRDKLVMYLEGHGERSLTGIANYDLGEFGKRLIENGYRVNGLNLTIAQDVPANASLLVITQPQVNLLPGEVDKLLRYIDGGGNLLWLIDAEPLHGLEPLAEKLGLLLTPGLVIDPAAEEMRAPANWALASGYPPHPVTHSFDLITVFPLARNIGSEENGTWQRSTLVEAAPNGWISTRKLRPKMHFDRNNDVPGPATIALALQRDADDRDQRIVVVGSGAFLANAYSGNGGNLDLGINMVNWLANEERLISIQPRSSKDSTVTLSRTKLSVISGTFLLALPLLLALTGGLIWRQRRK
jgi:ABC-type uncharacterized transport system involved in gliding motility auxiliary subunit